VFLPSVPLYWQHWRLGSSLVDDLTEAVVGAARSWMAGRDGTDLRFS
jgi:LysR family transcriptional regulator, chromosome initiation inhibitor